MRADYPLKKATQLYYSYNEAGYLKTNCPNFTYNNYREASYFKSNCPHITCN